MTKQVYMIQNLPEDVQEAIADKFAGEQLRGHTSPRQSWLRGLISIGALDTERAIASFELWQRALQIASLRGEDDLRALDSVKGKFFTEIDEFERLRDQKPPLIEIANRLANILYYAVQMYAQDNDLRSFDLICTRYCERAGLPQAIAFQCAAAKYRVRAPRTQKDVASEYRAMQHILNEFL